MLTYVHQFLDSLLFSVLVEMVVVLGLCFLFKKDKRIIIIAGLGTCLTIPYVWFVFPTLFWYSASTAVYLAEAFAFFVEAFLYKVLGKLNWRHALLFSFLANVSSYFLGKVF